MRHRALLVLFLAAVSLCAMAADAPSRPAFENCKWEKISDAKVGLAAWVQRCDYGFRKIDFVFDLLPRETPEAGLRRIFASRTDPAVAKRCRLVPSESAPRRRGVKRYSFVPDAAYRKELDAKAEDGIPEPPCGELGEAPDFIQYFEVQPKSGARRVMLVIAGQDTPLFDEETLRLLP